MSRRTCWVVSCAALAGCVGGAEEALVGEARAALGPPSCEDAARYELRDVGGAQFNNITLDPSILPLADVGKVLANDQVHMLRAAAENGLHVLNKHVPAFFIFDDQGNVSQIRAGGFYQCATLLDCQGYISEVVANYRLDGVLFVDRPEFNHSFQGHAYEVLGGAQFRPLTDDYAIKITRWQITTTQTHALRANLTARWNSRMRETACRRGTLAQALLLWSDAEQVVAEVVIGVKRNEPPPYFEATLAGLASEPVLDPDMDALPLVRIPPDVTDTYFVLTYWPGAFEPSLWLNSPSTTPDGPLPEPFCGDGSCNTTAANVENVATCPADCLATCGNGSCDPGESAVTCAVDCLPQ
ncbi:hypothetical protein KEG38_51060 [Polyangium jinanense]|uniref:hypothetical protein n=1 Tax=Polyangium jinanense TaxID=2829994 RepID=UPI002341B3F9|nr:hypothetical protein [Polyangium jinanense]MDC3962262.1 hypothetical protein [Polyangium jinanense]